MEKRIAGIVLFIAVFLFVNFVCFSKDIVIINNYYHVIPNETVDENGNIRLMQYQMGNFSSEEIHFGEDDFWYVKKVDSKENEMTVEVSRFFQKNTFVDMPNEAFVEIDACNLYQEFQDRDASMTYVIRYQDGKFSEPKLKSTKKLNEFSDYSSLCNKK